MFSKFTLLAVVLAFGLISALSITLKLNPSKLKLPTSKKILTLQQQTDMLAARDPYSSQLCFGHYLPILNDFTAQLEVDYGKCQKDFDINSDAVILAWNSTLYGIQQSAESGCSTFFDCSSLVDYVMAFECFASVGAEQSKIMYQVSANSLEAASDLKIHLQTLETFKTNCQNTADRDYVEGTASTYENLNKCLGGAPLPEQTTADWFHSTSWN
uniref:Uncharacterized protein LOC108051432 n=1 Tax=Drosophila rhopaloa TaxID=1041015 RepID=A0A6P4FF68_DRORH